MFTDIALSSPKTYKVVLAIISKLINRIPSTEEREKLSMIFI